MFRRALIIGLLGAGFLVLRGSDVRAHLSGYQVINGYVRHVSSFDCGIAIRGVPNPDTKPAALQCAATITEALVLCENPANHKVNPGAAGTQVVIVGQDQIDSSHFTDKKKGIANIAVRIEDEIPELLDPQFCVNPNWTPIDVLSTRVSPRLTTHECVGPDTDPCSVLGDPVYVEVLDCVLPSWVDFNTVVPPEGIPYDCSVISQQHLK